MLARLDKRLPLLTGGARDLPARQRTLRETIAWSYDLLAPGAQAFFRRISLFAGGMTLDAAAIVGDPEHELDALTSVEHLVEHSLVQAPDADGTTDHPRFRMLETIREYGLERLAEAGEIAAVSERHAALFLELAESAAPELEGPREGAWLDRLEADHDNLRAALDWTSDGEDHVATLRLAAALWPFWDARGHYSEGRAWLERALSANVAEPQTALAGALTGAGSIARMQGDADRAVELLERALGIWQELADQRQAARVLLILGHVADRIGELTTAASRFAEALAIGRAVADRSLVASALANLGIIADERGEYALAIERYEEALGIFRELGDRRREAAALDNLGIVARAQGDLATAIRRYEEAMAVRREVGDAWGVAATLGNLGVAAHQDGDLPRAREYYGQSLAGFRALGDRRGMANTLSNLGVAARQAGELGRAAELEREALQLYQEIGDRVGVATGLEGIAAIAVAVEESEAAARLFGAAEVLRANLGSALPPDDRPDYDRTISTTRALIGDVRLGEAWAVGRSRSLEDAVTEAMTLAQEIATSATAGS